MPFFDNYLAVKWFVQLLVISSNSQIVSVQGNLRINFFILLQTLFVIQLLIRKKSARINFDTLHFKYNYYLELT
jgi:hypothetical protein